MSATLAFDVYGTLINTHGLVSTIQNIIGDRAMQFSYTWRDKQLEYSFRRGLMENYQPFSVCTSDALDYTCAYYKVDFSPQQKKDLLESYRALPAFDDVKSGLDRLTLAGYKLYAFSNGKKEAVEGLLLNAEIRDYFIDVVSVDDLQSFKPNPAVYSHFLKSAGTKSDNAWLISSNPFDVIGAISAGMSAAWVKRSEDMVFDPWGIEPTLTIKTLDDLEEGLGTLNCSS